MAVRREVEMAFIERGWELYEKTKERTVLTKEGDEVYITDEELDGPASEYAEVEIKLSDIGDIGEYGDFVVTKATVRVSP